MEVFEKKFSYIQTNAKLFWFTCVIVEMHFQYVSCREKVLQQPKYKKKIVFQTFRYLTVTYSNCSHVINFR